MSRYIDLLLMSPPAIDAPSFVGVQDEYGAGVELGQWIGPDEECMFWRYRLDPAELLSYMIKGAEALGGQSATQRLVLQQEPTARQIERTAGRQKPTPSNAPNAGLSARNALRQRLAGVKPKSADAPTAEPIDPTATQKCPTCHVPYDPTRHELIACSGCGEDKCTARCIPNAAQPCLDCAALSAEPDEGGFNPDDAPPAAIVRTPGLKEQMAAESSGATQTIAGRLFDGAFHGKGGDTKEDEDE